MKPLIPLRHSFEEPQALVFTPLAWLKLQFFCHAGNTEVGGFGVSARNDFLRIEDFRTVRQQTSTVSVGFDDHAVADLFDSCVDQGLQPERFARCWMHTHPGSSPLPSDTDEATFARCFGSCAWAIMFIVGRTGLTYARLAFSAGPGGSLLLPVRVDWSAWPEALSDRRGKLESLVEAWQEEFVANIHQQPTLLYEKARTPTAESLLSERASMSTTETLTEPDWWEVEPWSEKLDAVFYAPAFEDADHDPFS